ncbi:Cytochrome c biogenesis protein [Halalkaliarchaeum sp. AArc-CO]|uniref:cytochrome c biogenesis protein CcdA n=1 Tax=unclassified Halalkaliarchaeum TaxID=2678344 RepID=UPI00217E81C6|nr:MULTISPECIES: cytochrome c biogenesis protein CcdA [unclassified Halalkaliarchaeum]MDR5673958.1 cytochrome c biogenesis protein CcdA [Halalkaliarchaeum sp. AArc-GB]UWG50594.1 Cytochrome c biogenesis protein [Halalkaliarchaeum sp. AArc-CO]
MTGLAGALGVAGVAGVATFFSPCAYALLPGYVGFYVSATGDRGPTLSGAAIRGLAAAAGAVGVVLGLGVLAAAAGDVVRSSLPFLEVGVGIALIGFGLITLLRVGRGWHVRLPGRRASVPGFALFGGLYAAAAAGCVAPVFFGVVVQSLAFPATGTIAVFLTYAVSLGLLLTSATVAIAVGSGFGFERLGDRPELLQRFAGVVLVVAGVGQLYVAYGGSL